jgi:hypothetical protein
MGGSFVRKKDFTEVLHFVQQEPAALQKDNLPV